MKQNIRLFLCAMILLKGISAFASDVETSTFHTQLEDLVTIEESLSALNTQHATAEGSFGVSNLLNKELLLKPSPHTSDNTIEYELPSLRKGLEVGASPKYQLTWMRTNEGVKPYKVMDDLTFVGIPVFVAGIIAKSEKKAFRQNTPDNKHTLLTDFKTEIDNYTQFFGIALATGLKIGGVESRSDWGRYLGCYHFA